MKNLFSRILLFLIFAQQISFFKRKIDDEKKIRTHTTEIVKCLCRTDCTWNIYKARSGTYRGIQQFFEHTSWFTFGSLSSHLRLMQRIFSHWMHTVIHLSHGNNIFFSTLDIALFIPIIIFELCRVRLRADKK